MQCSFTGCSWQPIAPSSDAAWRQHAEHFVEAHAEEVDAEIPDGMVQVQLEEDGEWITTTIEGARELHDAMHDD